MCPSAKVNGVWPFNDAWLRTSLSWARRQAPRNVAPILEVPHTNVCTDSILSRSATPWEEAAAMLGGALFLVLCDLLARTIHPPTEMRLGIITAAFGAPFFLHLLRRRRGGLGLP